MQGMQSSLHGMIDKAHRYAEEPERVQLAQLEAVVRGDNSDHTVTLTDGRLSCDCDHYEHERLCAHVLTVERLLKTYIPANARQAIEQVQPFALDVCSGVRTAGQLDERKLAEFAAAVMGAGR